MTLQGIAVLNLLHRPLRSLLTLLGVVLAIAAYVALAGLTRGIEGTLVENFSLRGTDVIITEGGAEDILSSVVPESLAGQVAQVEGVSAAVLEMGRMTLVGEATSFVNGWAPEAFAWETVTVTKGRRPEAQDKMNGIAGGIMLGRSLAARLELGLGDQVVLFSAPFEVTGIYDSDSLLVRHGAVTLLADMQAQTYRIGQGSALAVQLEPGLSESGRNGVIAQIAERFPAFSVEGTAEMVAGYFNVKIARILAWSVSTIAVITAGLGVLNTMVMSINERRGEIAIMGAVGWPIRRIIAVLMIEGGALTVLGTVLGIGVGIAAAWGVATSPAVAGFVEPDVGRDLVIKALVLGLGIGLLGAFIPAYRAAKQDPASILRGR
ncbi:MAG: ABC transporter permease [Maritimibacter sp.]